jgi:S1-C subfamily serine protease
VFRLTFTSRLVVAAVSGAILAASALGLSLGHGSSASAARTPQTGVVVINTNLAYQNGAAAGTGIVLSSSGLVLTNNHVIRGATAIHVTDVSDGRTFSATVVGYDVTHDIALVKVKNPSGLKTATVGNSSNVKVGDRVTAVGNAGGTGTLTVSTGALTRLHQSITVSDDEGNSSQLGDLLETSASLEPGDSGGPLLDGSGRVVGVDSAGSGGSRYQLDSGDGFAIPINTAVSIAKQIQSGHRSATVHVGPTAFLGVSVGQAGYVGQAASGAVVGGVVPGSAADQAGIEAGDVITSLAGHAVTSPTSLQRLVLQVSPGGAVVIGWVDEYGNAYSATVHPQSGPPQ